MLRRVLISATVIAIASFIVASFAVPQSSAAPTGTRLGVFQGEDVMAQVSVAQLSLGQRFSTDIWELEVQDAFVTESADRAGYVEVRASVAFRLLGGQSLPYEWAGFTGLEGYPTLQIVDSEGVVYPIDLFEPAHTMVPGSHLVSLEPFLPARWTVGFEANGPQSDELVIQAVWDGDPIVEWNVYSTPQALTGWTPPPAADVVGGDSEFAWDEQLSVTVIDHGTLACGDPASGPLFTAFAVQVSVENVDIQPGSFPNVFHPEPSAIAIWNDGSSAHLTTLTEATLAGSGESAIVINTRTHEQAIVPAGTLLDGFLTFALPRDGRFSDVNNAPTAVVFYPPNAPMQWWNVEGPGGVTFTDVCADTVGGTAFEATRP